MRERNKEEVELDLIDPDLRVGLSPDPNLAPPPPALPLPVTSPPVTASSGRRALATTAAAPGWAGPPAPTTAPDQAGATAIRARGAGWSAPLVGSQLVKGEGGGDSQHVHPMTPPLREEPGGQSLLQREWRWNLPCGECSFFCSQSCGFPWQPQMPGSCLR